MHFNCVFSLAKNDKHVCIYHVTFVASSLHRRLPVEYWNIETTHRNMWFWTRFFVCHIPQRVNPLTSTGSLHSFPIRQIHILGETVKKMYAYRLYSFRVANILSSSSDLTHSPRRTIWRFSYWAVNHGKTIYKYVCVVDWFRTEMFPIYF